MQYERAVVSPVDGGTVVVAVRLVLVLLMVRQMVLLLMLLVLLLVLVLVLLLGERIADEVGVRCARRHLAGRTVVAEIPLIQFQRGVLCHIVELRSKVTKVRAHNCRQTDTHGRWP